MEGTRPDPTSKLSSEVTVKPRKGVARAMVRRNADAASLRLVSGGKPAAGTQDFYVSSSSSIIGDDKTRGASRSSRARLLLHLPRLARA